MLGGALAGELLARIRSPATSLAAVRRAADALSTLVLVRCLEDLPSVEGRVATPLAEARALRIARPVTVVPVLRAGLAMLEPALRLLPEETRVGFVGLARDEESLAPVPYVRRLPPALEGDEVVVLDVMIATGGSAAAALHSLKEAGATSLRLAGIIAAPEGLARVAGEHPGVRVTVAAVDERLDARGFIVPGLGDAGDRLYGGAGFLV